VVAVKVVHMLVEVGSGEDFAVLVSVVWGVVTWVDEVVVVKTALDDRLSLRFRCSINFNGLSDRNDAQNCGNKFDHSYYF